jgi:hypothetical protein
LPDREALVARPELEVLVDDRWPRELSLEAEPPVTIRGQVRDATEQPLEQAAVRFERMLPTAPRGSPAPAAWGRLPALAAETSTDAGGAYILGGLLPGMLTGRAQKEGYGPAPRGARLGAGPLGSQSVDLSPAASAEGIDFYLARRSETGPAADVLRGRVLDTGGNPVPGVRVVACYPAQPGPLRPTTPHLESADTTTDADGRFELREPRERMQAVFVPPTLERPTYAFQRVSPATTETQVRLRACLTAEGRVEDESGVPIADASIQIGRPFPSPAPDLVGFSMQGRSDAQGRFRLALLPSEPVQLTAEKEGFQDRGAGHAMVDPFGARRGAARAGSRGTPPELVLVLGAPHFGRARLVDTAGLGLAGWTVRRELSRKPGVRGTPRLPNDPFEVIGPTGAQGEFDYTLGDGLNTLKFRPPADASVPAPVTVEYSSGPLESPGPIPEQDLRFVIPTPGWLFGQAVSAESGLGIPAVEIQISGSLERGLQDRPWPEVAAQSVRLAKPASTGEQGRFEIAGLPPARYTLTFSAPAILTTRVSDVPVAEGLPKDMGAVRLPSACMIVGRLLREPGGEPIDGGVWRMEVLQNPRDADPSGVRRGMLVNPNRPDAIQGRLIDLNGRFEITRVPADTTAVMIKLISGGDRPNSFMGQYLVTDLERLDLSPGQVLDVGNVRIRSHRLRMTLVDRLTGNPLDVERLQGLRLSINASLGPQSLSISSGIIRTGDLARATPYTLPFETALTANPVDVDCVPTEIAQIAIAGPKFPQWRLDSVPPPDAQGVTDLGRVELDLGHTVRGVVRGPNGQPARSVQLSFRVESGGVNVVRTNDRGEFVIEGIRTGPASVSVLATNRNDTNPWLGEEGARRTFQQQFTVAEEGETILNLTFPDTPQPQVVRSP